MPDLPPAPPGAATLTCLGVGDGWLAPDRGHAAFLYQVGATQLLVDCGEPAAGVLCRRGWQADDLDGILVSHLHFDHVGGLFTLLQAHGLGPRRRPLPVYLPRPGLAPVRGLLRAGWMQALPVPLPVELHAWRAGKTVAVGGVTVTPLPSSHLEVMCGAEPGRDRFAVAFSFLLAAGERRVAHSADLGGIAELERLVRDPLDLLVCELSHLDPAAVWAALEGRRIRRALFVHLSAAQWRERAALRARAAAVLAPIEVGIPADGERVCF